MGDFFCGHCGTIVAVEAGKIRAERRMTIDRAPAAGTSGDNMNKHSGK
jgi:hypothetical protein